MTLESHVDVLIIGAGPAGLMLANALSMAGGINVKVVDKRPNKIPTGQADGIQARSVEVWQSYGLAERLIREGNQMHTNAFYNPGPNGGIECTGRVFGVSSRNARFPFQVTLHQGAIEAIFLDSMKAHGVEVERSREPSALEVSDDLGQLYPVKVTVEHLDDGKSEIVYAKYVVGADGAHSWVRKTLGIEMEGEKTDFVWGVLDLVPETDFPDVRNLSIVHSTSGTFSIIPRENDIVRMYIQLSDTDLVDPSTGKIDSSRITPESLLLLVQKMIRPFKLTAPQGFEWWTVYGVAQRVAASYSSKDRVYIIGDACHTHSAKAGQGMNAGMNDSHNLAWKLVQVLRGWSSPSLLKTYEHERRKFAQELINFDKNLIGRMSGKPGREKNQENTNNEGFLRSSQEFISGLGIHYTPSAIVDLKHQNCSEKLVIGKRMPPHIFVRAADSRPIELHDMLPSDVRFKVLFFMGNLTGARIAQVEALAEQLDTPSSVFRRYTTDGNIASVFDIITITADKKGDINHLIVPPFFRSHWSKVLLDDTDTTGSKGGHGYAKFGIDPSQITVVIVRPDGYVGTIVPSKAIGDLDTYFGSFMVPRSL